MLDVKTLVRAIRLESAVKSAGFPMRDGDYDAHQRKRLQEGRGRFDEDEKHGPYAGDGG